jgi:peptidoglycan L-alanyl-D-glutamate endopeptidase CwlK
MIELRPGSAGPSVMLLQIRLLALGFDPNGLDGTYGPGTERAVRAFQDSFGLDVDGFVGPDTAEALELNVDGEIPSGFDGVSVTAVSKMFSPHTPLKNIRQHLPNVLASLVDTELRDQKMVLMALSTVRAETEGFAPSQPSARRSASRSPSPR